MPKQSLIGAHVSAAGGIDVAIDNITAIGGNCVQIFSASPRVWVRKKIDEDQVKRYNQKAKEQQIHPSVIHAMYLVNLAALDPDMLAKSMNALKYDLDVASKINAIGVVVHVGSYQDRGFATMRKQMVKSITSLLESTPDNAILLMENSAGQGGKVGSKLEELCMLMDDVKSDRLGWCLDSCHAYAAGYSLVPNPDAKYLFDVIEELKLANTLRVVHVNDSRDEFFSHRDRHANLSEGFIGTEPLKAFVNHPLVKDKPLILEVPGMDGKSGPDTENIKRLTELLK